MEKVTAQLGEFSKFIGENLAKIKSEIFSEGRRAGLEEAARAMCGGCKEGAPMTTNGDMELCHYKLHSNGYTKILSQCRAGASAALELIDYAKWSREWLEQNKCSPVDFYIPDMLRDFHAVLDGGAPAEPHKEQK